MKSIPYVLKLNTLKNSIVHISKRFRKKAKKEEATVLPRSKKEIRKLYKNRKSKETNFSRMKKNMIGVGKDTINLGVATVDVANSLIPNDIMKGIILTKKGTDKLEKGRRLISSKNKPKLEITENLLKGSGSFGKLVSSFTFPSSKIELISQGSEAVGSSLGLARNCAGNNSKNTPSRTKKIIEIGSNGYTAANESWKFQKMLRKIEKN